MSASDKVWADNQPPQCDAADLNGFKNENSLLILGSGQALNPVDNQQTHKAVSHYAAAGDFYTDTGAANAYVFSVIAPRVAPPAYVDGMRVRAFITNENASAPSTVNVAGLGPKSVLTQLDSAQPRAGEISGFMEFIFNASNDRFEIISRKVSTQEFTTSGTYTMPADVKTITVELVAGGAGGGASGTTSSRGGGGGSAGGYAKETLSRGTVGVSTTVTVGTGGAGGVGADGGNGGVTSFGALISASGGIGGLIGSSSLAGNPGGIGAGGDVNIQGGSGAPANGTTANGQTGAASYFGGGGVGGIANRVGTDGVAPGSGGGGGSTVDATSLDGGDGAPGIVIVTEYR